MGQGNSQDPILKKLLQENSKLKLEARLRKSLSLQLEKQRHNIAVAKKKLRQEVSKLQLEARLRKSLSSQLEKQRKLIVEAKAIAQHKSDELHLISTQLAKYLSPQIHEKIFSEQKGISIKSGRKKLTIFFSDIVSFTNITEQLEPEELTALLNYYLNEMSELALEYGGTIDKFIGDALMIFFGDPDSNGFKKDAENCVYMAIAMQQRMSELANEWGIRFSLKKPLQIRMGISTGFCTVGNFGSNQRLDYTAIGAPVNLASRVQGAAYPNSIFISEETYLLVQDTFSFSESVQLRLKGITHPVVCYALSSGSDKESESTEFMGKRYKLKIDEKNFSKKDHAELKQVIKKITPKNN